MVLSKHKGTQFQMIKETLRDQCDQKQRDQCDQSSETNSNNEFDVNFS